MSTQCQQDGDKMETSLPKTRTPANRFVACQPERRPLACQNPGSGRLQHSKGKRRTPRSAQPWFPAWASQLVNPASTHPYLEGLRTTRGSQVVGCFGCFGVAHCSALMAPRYSAGTHASWVLQGSRRRPVVTPANAHWCCALVSYAQPHAGYGWWPAARPGLRIAPKPQRCNAMPLDP